LGRGVGGFVGLFRSSRTSSRDSIPGGRVSAAREIPVFCLSGPLPAAAGGDSTARSGCEHEREVAAAPRRRAGPFPLEPPGVQDTTRCWYSYYQRDMAVIDWDAALLIDAPEEYNDTLYAIEMANLQLEELRVYDQKLDDVLDKAYCRRGTHDAFVRVCKTTECPDGTAGDPHGHDQGVDEISNITKFFGDWHLARIYMGCRHALSSVGMGGIWSVRRCAPWTASTRCSTDSMSRADTHSRCGHCRALLHRPGRHYPPRHAIAVENMRKRRPTVTAQMSRGKRARRVLPHPAILRFGRPPDDRRR